MVGLRQKKSSGVVTLPNGDVLVANYSNADPSIYRFAKDGTALGKFADADGLITDMKLGSDGLVYVVNAPGNLTGFDAVTGSSLGVVATNVNGGVAIYKLRSSFQHRRQWAG